MSLRLALAQGTGPQGGRTAVRAAVEGERQVVGERLQKILSRAGVASRRKAEGLILEGRVSVNGVVVKELGTRAVWGKDEIRIDGAAISSSVETVVLALCKPRGCVTTLRDPQGRTTVAHVLGNLPWRLYPVGRLDYDAEGLLLLTNDGILANHLLHPRYEVPRVYEVEVEGLVPVADLPRWRKGVALPDGPAVPRSVSLLRRGAHSTWLRVTFAEGRYREVKRYCKAMGHVVRRLHRVEFGPLRLGSLPSGRWRELTAMELARLKSLRRS